ncbi:hypothetical protein BU14_1493s0001 [Porphyra umbilicalis]|uniref:VHS domain-containing protein n=1 Tax=Porphyra umbilicalis TaxID=2786 RepID=A0A1X6NLJ3_PORUM|nr:hypothetical protein BU14_1493s0001 [Porphyra umbilicalis]|eukprot:OSX69457.1 hypothetical protein BU14_1493s0001 [Porphyra umbilicalis]
MNGPAGSVRNQEFVTRIVVLVDEATEAGVAEDVAEKKRVALVRIVLAEPGGGSAVMFAIRKRLKSMDEVPVLNALTLLDELMRTCPFFYRFAASEKVFRRMWRFVVPDYKESVKGKVFKKSVFDGRTPGGRTQAAERVLILIRAWAETLSTMFRGRFDPAAGFLIERYNNKRTKIAFPPVPPSELPWVCPISPSAEATTRGRPSRSASAPGGRSTSAPASGLPPNLSLTEVENTVTLFENMLEKASNAEEVKGDVFTDLAVRCQVIYDNMHQLAVSMERDGEVARASRTNDRLRNVLSIHREAVETGRLAPISHIPVVNMDSDMDDPSSDDDIYDARPLPPPVLQPYGVDEEEEEREREAARKKAARREKEKKEKEREKEREKELRKKEKVKEERKAKKEAGMLVVVDAAESGKSSARKDKKSKKKRVDSSDSDSSADVKASSRRRGGGGGSKAVADPFAMLAERYNTATTTTSTDTIDVTTAALGNVSLQPQASQMGGAPGMMYGNAYSTYVPAPVPQMSHYPQQSMRGVPQGQPQMMQQPQQQQQAGMYGGFNPAVAATAAYQTVDPTAAAAAYQSVNPAMYATQMQMYGSVAYGGGGGAPQPPPTHQYGVNPYATGQRMANPYTSAAAYNSFAVAPGGLPNPQSQRPPQQPQQQQGRQQQQASGTPPAIPGRASNGGQGAAAYAMYASFAGQGMPGGGYGQQPPPPPPPPQYPQAGVNGGRPPPPPPPQ